MQEASASQCLISVRLRFTAHQFGARLTRPSLPLPILMTSDEYSDELKQILVGIVSELLDAPDQPTDLWQRLGDVAQSCPPSVLSSLPSSLLLAAWRRKPIICRLLLARCADMATLVGADDKPVLVRAMLGWCNERDGAWADKGARLRAIAAETDVCRALIGGGAFVDVQDEEGNTPLSIACMYGQVELVEMLLAAPGKRLGWEKSGEVVVNGDDSLLTGAVMYGHFEVVKVLCREEFMPRVIVVDDKSLTLGEIAERQGFDEIVDFLEAIAWKPHV